MTNPLDLLRTPAFLLKLLQLLLACLCVALFASGTLIKIGIPKLIVVIGTFVGFLKISVIEILGAIIGSPLHRTLVLVISLPAAALFVAAGGFLLEVSSEGVLIVAGILAIFNGVVHLANFALVASGRMQLPN